MLVHTIRTPLIDEQGRLEGLIGFGMDIGVGSGDNLLNMVRSWKGEGGPVPIHPSVYVLPGKNGGQQATIPQKLSLMIDGSLFLEDDLHGARLIAQMQRRGGWRISILKMPAAVSNG